MTGQRIRVSGIVQGVGFRPTVWRLAQDEQLVGVVWNDGEGVEILAWGSTTSLQRFVQRLRDEPPPLAAISDIRVDPLDAASSAPTDFRIVDSRSGETHTDIAADAATCSVCLKEILDPVDRRYRYPFTNCTHCGPRLSIIREIPYDRANTSMAPFTMCPTCQVEYDNPADRRFHAQPNACPECGPQLWLEDRQGTRLELQEDEDLITLAARLLGEGRIVAIKGVGGFHLACDAGNREAVETLRQRKQRYHKPFALMACDVEMVSRYAEVNEREAELLTSTAAPIVVLPQAGEALPEALTPGQQTLGFMLPYTPLHHLLMREMSRPIVLTSGNRSHEPQVIDNEEARQQLGPIADYFMLHDRAIVNRLDDSVVRIAEKEPRLLRRARGYAPQPIRLLDEFAHEKSILAMGAELKSTFCLLRDGKAILSQHIGDLEDARTHQSYRDNLQLYRQLFDFAPDVIAVDAHPNYLSSQLGQAMAAEEGIHLVTVQHHHAHIAACMVEHGVTPHEGWVLGVAMDGLGYGENGELWGGEFLLADYAGYQRIAHFESVAMLGGAQAMYEPWRNTYAHLATTLGWETVASSYAGLEIVDFLQRKPLATLDTMIARGLNSPRASSAGRLFDAVAAALGLCRERAGYEGQAAIELEAIATPEMAATCADYPIRFIGAEIQWAPLWQALFDDLKSGVAPAIIAARFHHSVAHAICETSMHLCSAYNIDTVVLSGGVFQNRLLLEGCAGQLRNEGLRVLSPLQTPANDGGIALGQAVVALYNS